MITIDSNYQQSTLTTQRKLSNAFDKSIDMYCYMYDMANLDISETCQSHQSRL